jgi:hypothetical protein
VLLVPAVWFGSFALFLFVFAIERRLLDWILFFYAVVIFALMLAAVVLTGRFIRLGKLRIALALYIAPVLLVAILVLHDLAE